MVKVKSLSQVVTSSTLLEDGPLRISLAPASKNPPAPKDLIEDPTDIYIVVALLNSGPGARERTSVIGKAIIHYTETAAEDEAVHLLQGNSSKGQLPYNGRLAVAKIISTHTRGEAPITSQRLEPSAKT